VRRRGLIALSVKNYAILARSRVLAAREGHDAERADVRFRRARTAARFIASQALARAMQRAERMTASQTDEEQSTAMSQTQIAKYEAWIRRIEGLQARDARNRQTYFRIFVAIPIVFSLGFFWGRWFGVAALLTGLLMCLFGFYTFLTIEGDYERELEGLRRSADELRSPHAQ
jgi:hypothetical protein